ncbi:hypothetical protein FRC10_001769 [Ceratobasidium sp. 414]|nr:hypothetical protein FRC10_001769 [Ceratobasidium sp. 414]
MAPCRQREGDEEEAAGPGRHRNKKQQKEWTREEIHTLQDQLRERDEAIGQMQEDIELEDQPAAAPGPQHADDGGEPRLSRSEVKTWMKYARIAGCRAAVLHEPFPNIDALGDHQVQAHLEEILADVQKAKDSDEELDDENNPALFFDTPRFDVAGLVDMAREIIFHLPKSPGKAWLEEWFLDPLKLGAWKQHGDLAHAIVENYQKIFDIYDQRFEDCATRCEIPEVENLTETFMHTAHNNPMDIFFRHKCIVRVLRLLLNGPSAILL